MPLPKPVTALAPPMPAPLIERFATIVGPRYAITDPGDQAPYLRDDRSLYHGRTSLVVRPGSTEEVAAVMALAHETGTPVVPQGGATGLVGGHVPHETGAEIVLSLNRMTAVRDVDPAGNTMTVDAGVTLQQAQDAASEVGRLFPLNIGSKGSCTIGGNLSTNAGGTQAVAYGMARDLVLGLEVVLADGRIWHGLRTLKKDNTGYDLKHLFMGAEGTLGIITAAVLKLYPAPRAIEAAWVAVPSPEAGLALLNAAQERAGPSVTGFELMPRNLFEFVLRHLSGARDPLADASPWYCLMELSTASAAGLRETLEEILAAGFEEGIVTDAALADTIDQRNAFWRLREGMSEVQKLEGGSIKHDVSVPVAAVPDFIAAAVAACLAYMPDCRPVPFGHLGDGNIHFNISQPVGMDKAAFLEHWDAVQTIVHDIVGTFGGSISAEHGIGRMKRDLLPAVKDPVAMDIMRQMKAVLDPKGILNPGKVL
ncbi:MAG: FAD-binding oxidoreductase [Phreatobacter sp.]|uniref:FAD-binding oxidoreductase n=1 Tax=Phreatobacter sp. TaxID=1966341 RepID=UPI00273355A1|nr:FAD-binding oxidoreductase [Phreatobacter sp.]MDP2803466.1 FAD-binding oxidoreductase [Phreatobacter sp.]